MKYRAGIGGGGGDQQANKVGRSVGGREGTRRETTF
jgi:hypothetical protein